MMLRKHVARLTAIVTRTICAALLVSALPVAAQPYPSRPIRIIVPFPPSGSTDVYSRVLAKELQAAWGQSVIIDNRPGGTGIIGTQILRQSAPDGQTLLFTSNTGHVLGPLLHHPRPFDPVADFTPLSMSVRFPLYLIVTPGIPARSVKEFIAYAKSNRGRLNYASSGEGGYSHLAALLFNASAGIEATHLPYKGAAPAQQAVMAGEAQYRFDNVGTSHPFVLGGRLRGLGLTGTSRSSAAPEVPTLAEEGVRGLEGIYTWLGLFGPARLAPALRDKLSTEAIRIMRLPEVMKRAANDGYEIVASTPTQFTADIRTEVQTLERVVREKGIKAQ